MERSHPKVRTTTATSGPGAGNGGRPRGFLRPCILLLLAEGPTHGYGLVERLGAFGFDRTQSGAVYRTLRLLEDEGLVRSTSELSGGGPARRTYGATVPGREHLTVCAEWMRQSLRVLDQFAQRHAELPEVRAARRSGAA